MNDGVSYARTAQALAQKGKIVYNGWGSPLLWPQLAYGALVIQLWGFSHAALAVTGIVFAALCTATMYLLARACGCPPLLSCLATAGLTLNAVFLGVAPTFMTETPSLFLLLLSLLVLVRSLRTGGDGAIRVDKSRFWLSVALGIIAGSNRQINWIAYLGALAALVTLVPTARRLLLPAAALVLGCAASLTLWFNRQPYTVPADVTTGLLFLVGYTNIALMFTYKFLNMLGLFLFPLALLALRGRPVRGAALPVLLVLCFIPVFHAFGTTLHLLNGEYRLTVYGQYFTSAGTVVGGVEGFAERPPVFPAVVAQGLIILGAIGLAVTGYVLGDWWKEMRRVPPPRRTVSQVAVAVMVVVSLSQIAASIPWYAQLNVFDRYLLFLLPGFFILFAARAAAAREGADRRSRQVMIGAAAVLLGAMWITGIGFYVEYINNTRARAYLYGHLIRQGVPPRSINAGVELNADTQIRLAGHVNNPAVKNPPGGYREDAKATGVRYRPEMFPVINAQYLLSTEEAPDPTFVFPEPVLSTTYASPIFAPRRRAMFLYRIRR